MVSEGALFHSLREILRDLKSLKVDFALVGGLAVAFRAVERATKDIDLAVAVKDDVQAEQVVLALRQAKLSNKSCKW